MIRKNRYHKLKTNPWYREDEPHNNHETLRRQTKQSNQLSLFHQDDCKTRMDIKQNCFAIFYSMVFNHSKAKGQIST